MTWHRKKSLHDLHRLGPYRQEAHTDSATRSPPHRVTPKVHRPPPPPLSHTHIAQQTEIHTAISNRLVKIKSKMQTIINRPPSEPWQRPHRVKKRPQGHQSTQEATQKLAPYQLHPAAFCDWRPMHAPPDGAATYR